MFVCSRPQTAAGPTATVCTVYKTLFWLALQPKPHCCHLKFFNMKTRKEIHNPSAVPQFVCSRPKLQLPQGATATVCMTPSDLHFNLNPNATTSSFSKNLALTRNGWIWRCFSLVEPKDSNPDGTKGSLKTKLRDYLGIFPNMGGGSSQFPKLKTKKKCP